METAEQNNFGIKDLVNILTSWYRYVLLKKIPIIVVTIIGSILGFFYASYQKPVYTAEIVFVSDVETSSKLGGYASIAAQFGFDLGGTSNVFVGDNLLELYRSKSLIQKALQTSATIDKKNMLLIEHYIATWGLSKKWANDPYLSTIKLGNSWNDGNRKKDSILNFVTKQILKSGLNINYLNKDVSIISAKMTDRNEAFAKLFLETLTQKTIDFYVDYKIGKAQQNVSILQQQTDSIKSLLSGDIENVAIANDININPIKQKARTSVQRKQIDLQASSAMYIELLKNLELSKISLRKETPLIKLIDTPIYPLEITKMGKLKGIIIFGFLGFFLCVLFFGIKQIISQ